MITYDFGKWRTHFISIEGNINHMYLDGKGVVTIGIGCQLFRPSAKMLNKATDALASQGEVTREWLAIRILESGQSMLYYDKVCRLYMIQNDIDILFKDRLQSMIQLVEDNIVDLTDYPEQASLAFIDMAFNLGEFGLKSKFPKFTNAFKVKDWHTCFQECEREDIQRERNDWTKDIFTSLEKGSN